MKQITNDWNKVTGLVRRINYLKIGQNYEEMEKYINALDNKLIEYWNKYEKPYNPAVPE